jgi:hypothetical protein
MASDPHQAIFCVDAKTNEPPVLGANFVDSRINFSERSRAS